MDFSTKAVNEISTVMTAEISWMIEQEAIQDLHELENGIRSLLQEVGRVTYGKVLEQEDEKHGRWEVCECGAQAERTLKREAHTLTVFGWVSYRRGYYNCQHCGHKEHRLDQEWGLHPGEVSPCQRQLDLPMATIRNAHDAKGTKVLVSTIARIHQSLPITAGRR